MLQKNRTIQIKIEEADDLFRFEKGLLNVLSQIEIDNCQGRTKEGIEAVYKLLHHIQSAINEMQSRAKGPSKKSTSKHPAS